MSQEERALELIDRILPPLVHERRLDFSNRSVIGGLDQFLLDNLQELKSQLTDGRFHSLLDELLHLFSGYSQQGKGERRKRSRKAEVGLLWIKRTLIYQQRVGSQSFLRERVNKLKGIGASRAKKLKKMNIESIEDLLYHLPRGYEDRSKITAVSSLEPDFDRLYTLRVEVINISRHRPRPRLDLLRVKFSDGTGHLWGIWFNQGYLAQKLSPGDEVYLSGNLEEKSYQNYRRFEMNNPSLERVGEEGVETCRLLPLYSVTKGISQKMLRRLMLEEVKPLLEGLRDPLPPRIKEGLGLLNYQDSFYALHFPQEEEEPEEGRKRLAFDEFLFFQLALQIKKSRRQRDMGLRHSRIKGALEKYREELPFQLTSAQRRVWSEIEAEMEKEEQMWRLLQGDVGSGKTVIAAMALIKAIESGYQAAIMAPTEILAEQHSLELASSFNRLGLKSTLLLGSLSPAEKERCREEIASGSSQLIIGTHSLIQSSLSFRQLGLVVIDEQHRFGVSQRGSLLEKGLNPDLLDMTATPIPRSLALTLYGDLELSVIDELPPGRKEIQTLWREELNARVVSFLRQRLSEGGRIYYVCPLIQASEELELEAVEEKTEELKEIFAFCRVKMLHGQMKGEEKQATMEAFRRGEIKILVATSVIEVGVNVPEATVMVVEDAFRFGLAQLHQLRGRVGRGKRKSYCLLLGKPTTEEGGARLKAMLRHQDGFKLAEEDLRIRGPGEFFGHRQHGLPEFRVAHLLRDRKLLLKARRIAGELDEKGLLQTDFMLLRWYLEERFGLRVEGRLEGLPSLEREAGD